MGIYFDTWTWIREGGINALGIIYASINGSEWPMGNIRVLRDPWAYMLRYPLIHNIVRSYIVYSRRPSYQSRCSENSHIISYRVIKTCATMEQVIYMYSTHRNAVARGDGTSCARPWIMESQQQLGEYAAGCGAVLGFPVSTAASGVVWADNHVRVGVSGSDFDEMDED
jgi:hypothetical protein